MMTTRTYYHLAAVLLLAAAIVAARVNLNGDQEALNSPLRFTMEDIDGSAVELAGYQGRVVMLVNVASKCGLTPQYEALQALYETFSDSGFTILAFPANDFKQQEPGTNEEIKEFCSANYGVAFPLFSKVSVKGGEICPLYRYLTSEETNPGFSGEISWNFTKFLLDRSGRVVARFEPKTRPDDQAVLSAVRKELSAN